MLLTVVLTIQKGLEVDQAFRRLCQLPDLMGFCAKSWRDSHNLECHEWPMLVKPGSALRSGCNVIQRQM